MRKGFLSTISILDFIRTGKFGTVELGQNYQEILRTFSKPDDVSRMSPGIYIGTYSAFEFHFIDGILTLLWCDSLGYMYSPRKKQFKLDRWIIGRYKDGFSLSRFILELEKESIQFKLFGTYYSSDPTNSLPDNVILKVNNATTIIYFENVDDNATSFYDYKLIAIGSSSDKHEYKTYLL